MKYKNKTIQVLILMLTLALFSSCETKKPNIIFLLGDDHRWDALGVAGNPYIQTPNLDKLANNGVRFENAFVTTSICCCSRASIFTGQYVKRHTIDWFLQPLTDEQYEQTYPMQLKQAGYNVGFIGKYGIGKGHSLEREKATFDYFWGSAEQPKYESTDNEGNPVHYTELVTKHISKFLAEDKEDKPFCLSVSFKSPHVEDGDKRQFIPHPKYKHLYEDIEIPYFETNANIYEEQFPDFFRNPAEGKENEARRRWEMRFSTPEKYQKMVKGYYRLITGIDDMIGHLQQELEEKGIADNTIIIYLGDNGFYLGEHGLAGKWYGHEESIRVPLIIYDPRNKGGIVEEKMVLNIDIAPTLLEYAQVKIPEGIQGKSLVGLAQEKQEEWRDGFYYEHPFSMAVIPPSHGFRTENYKYLVYPESPNQYEEIYDLKNDPKELNNLALKEEHKALLQKLRTDFKAIEQSAL